MAPRRDQRRETEARLAAMSVEQLQALVDPVKDLPVDQWSDEQLQASVELDRRERPLPGHPEWSVGHEFRGPNGELSLEVYPTGTKVQRDEYGYLVYPGAFAALGQTRDECVATAIEYIEGQRGLGIRFG